MRCDKESRNNIFLNLINHLVCSSCAHCTGYYIKYICRYNMNMNPIVVKWHGHGCFAKQKLTKKIINRKIKQTATAHKHTAIHICKRNSLQISRALCFIRKISLTNSYIGIIFCIFLNGLNKHDNLWFHICVFHFIAREYSCIHCRFLFPRLSHWFNSFVCCLFVCLWLLACCSFLLFRSDNTIPIQFLSINDDWASICECNGAFICHLLYFHFALHRKFLSATYIHCIGYSCVWDNEKKVVRWH